MLGVVIEVGVNELRHIQDIRVLPGDSRVNKSTISLVLPPLVIFSRTSQKMLCI